MLHEKLLIVDDDPSIRKSLDIMLSMHGYEVITSAGGRDALIDVEREDPDLILTDVNMPGMDGIALLELLKENAPGIGIILITGFGSIEDAVKAMRLGAFDYITKPINDDEILTQIARYFEQKNLRRENLELRQQTAQALDTHKQMRERLQLVKEERSQAITGFKEVLDTAGQLKQDTAQLTQRIQQLEQENQQLRTTITELTEQLEQLIINSEALETSTAELMVEPLSP